MIHPYSLAWQTGPASARNYLARSKMPKTTVKSGLGIERDQEILVRAPEVSVFIHCLVIVNQLRALERAFKNAEIDRAAFLDKSNSLLGHFNEAVSATERFDIVLPVMDYGQFSPFFWRWFNWWDDYFKGLTTVQIVEIERLARERPSVVGSYRPEAHWSHHRHTPAFTLVPA